MTDDPFVAAVRAWLASREGIVSTHYDDCWKHHPDCVAAALMKRLDAADVAGRSVTVPNP